MPYHILSKGKRIASFVEEADRDVCFDALVDYWGEENNFTVEDE